MNFHFTPLWTDLLIYLLVIGGVIFFIWARKQAHLRMAWHDVTQNRLAMISAVILTVYMSIALADSIHFEYQNPVQQTYVRQSLLDYLVSPLGQRDEQSYSAPFATHLYSKEFVKLPNGATVQDYPVLQYAGENLAAGKNKLTDILQRCSIASIKAIVTWLIACSIIIFILAYQRQKSFLHMLKKISNDQTKTRWRTILITVGIVLLIIWNAFALAQQYHIFGTDKVGHDMFYQSLKSIRTGVVIGTLTTLIIAPLAVFLGMLAGYFRGWIDDGVQYLYTTLSSVPDVLLIAASILALQLFISNHGDLFPNIAERADARLLALCIILGITSWTGLCRLLRGETLKLREQDYVQAAKVLGSSSTRILLQHILPNLLHLILIALVMDFSGLVLAEAVLTYVGVGVDPSTVSWGNIINSARLELARDPVVWWPLTAAFVLMFILVISANLFADALRDALDPRVHSRMKGV
jgi:peptide/nickel transport system permease protein